MITSNVDTGDMLDRLYLADTAGGPVQPRVRHGGGVVASRLLSTVRSTVADRSGSRSPNLSQRTSIRRFITETGLPPMRWLTVARIDYAKQILERTDAPIDEVARTSGLGTAANFRTHFAQHCGLSPSAYRHLYARDHRPGEPAP